MTPDTQALMVDLDAALSTASNSQYLAILRGVTDLFLAGAAAYRDEHVAVFDDVMAALIKKLDDAALVELSTRLAPITNAPPNVSSALARHDNIAVSGPLLKNSSALADPVLAEIAAAKGQKHLAAIAARGQIGDIVTDVLIDRANADVARQVASNTGARLSEIGFVKLINKAKTDRVLAEAIAKRTDMPPELEPFLKLTLVS